MGGDGEGVEGKKADRWRKHSVHSRGCGFLVRHVGMEAYLGRSFSDVLTSGPPVSTKNEILILSSR
jgi:hypothetical protein